MFYTDIFEILQRIRLIDYYMCYTGIFMSEVDKMAQNWFIRDRSREWICIQTSKWPNIIPIFPFQMGHFEVCMHIQSRDLSLTQQFWAILKSVSYVQISFTRKIFYLEDQPWKIFISFPLNIFSFNNFRIFWNINNCRIRFFNIFHSPLIWFCSIRTRFSIF